VPTDLEHLFRHILNRIDKAYLAKSAELLFIALHENSGLLPPLPYYFHERDHGNENYTVAWRIHLKAHESAHAAQELAIRRLTALTGGLLEAQGKESWDSKVGFLHRTVAEFLLDKDIANDIHTRLRPNFDVNLALAKMTAVLFQSHSTLITGFKSWLPVMIDKYLPQVNERSVQHAWQLVDANESTYTHRLVTAGVHEFRGLLLLLPDV
jgi:hypothetical protein